MVDRELTGDEAQRALSEAMRRTRATMAPTPAELIAFVHELEICFPGKGDARMFSALLSVLEQGPSSLATGAGTDLKRAKALKLLEAMVEPCEHQQKSGEHEWRKCRRCLAHREAENAHGTALLAVLLTELQEAR